MSAWTEIRDGIRKVILMQDQLERFRPDGLNASIVGT